MLFRDRIEHALTVCELRQVLLALAQEDPVGFLNLANVSQIAREAMNRLIEIRANSKIYDSSKQKGELREAARTYGCVFGTLRLSRQDLSIGQLADEAANQAQRETSPATYELLESFWGVVRGAYCAAAATLVRQQLTLLMSYYRHRFTVQAWIEWFGTGENANKLLGIERDGIVLDIFRAMLAERLEAEDEYISCPSREQAEKSEIVLAKCIAETMRNFAVYDLPIGGEERTEACWQGPYEMYVIGSNALPEVDGTIAIFLACLHHANKETLRNEGETS